MKLNLLIYMNLKKIKSFVIILMGFLSLPSCKENLEKEVYFGFKLGRSLKYNTEKEKELVSNGTFLSTDESKYPFAVNEFRYIDNNYFKYYSTPYFFRLKGDTTVVEIHILFFTEVKNLDFDMKTLGDGKTPMNIPNLPPMKNNILIPGFRPISDDVLKKVVSKYGENYQKILPPGTSDDVEHPYVVDTKYIWRNRDGIDIELDVHPMDYGFERNFSSLILKYKYSESIRKNLKEKSEF